MVPLWTWRGASEQPGCGWLWWSGEVVYNMDVPWDFLLLSPPKKKYCTTGNYNNIVFFCDICCVCFLFSPPKIQNSPTDGTVGTATNGVRPTISQVNPQVNPCLLPSHGLWWWLLLAAATKPRSWPRLGGWKWREGARPQPKRDFPWDETVYLTLFNDPWMVDFYTIQ